MRPWSRGLLLAVVGLLLLLPARPASADPARPTNYRSDVTDLVDGAGGSVSGVTAEVVGGDTYLVLGVTGAEQVEVPGYEGEPYLRFDGDGRVEVNVRSPARWLNDARFGALEVQVPPTADAEAAPQWETVATNGRYAWHDHRIHFMSPTLPDDVDPTAGTTQEVFAWEVPLVVDGAPARIEGTLVWLPGPPVGLPIALAALTLAAAVGLGRRPTPDRGVAVVTVGLAALAAGTVATVSSPPGGEAEPALIVLPAVGVAVGLLARLRPGVTGVGGWLTDAAAIPLLGWGLWSVTVWWRPIAPTPLPIGIVRGLVAAALAVGLAGMVALGRRALQAIALDDGDVDPSTR
ncbi:MAG: hypothetical protein R6U94_04915 [Nitriliruptoraceae bacterium]